MRCFLTFFNCLFVSFFMPVRVYGITHSILSFFSRFDNYFNKQSRYAVSTQWERSVHDGTAPRDVHTYFCCCATRIGHMFALMQHHDGEPIVLAGPCWPFCVFVTVPLILGVSCLVTYFLVIDDNFGLVRTQTQYTCFLFYCSIVIMNHLGR